MSVQGTWVVSLDVGGTATALEVTATISGGWRPARISGDPDSCYEAGYPEIEALSARYIDMSEDLDGKPFDLKSLTEDEARELERALGWAILLSDGCHPDDY